MLTAPLLLLVLVIAQSCRFIRPAAAEVGEPASASRRQLDSVDEQGAFAPLSSGLYVSYLPSVQRPYTVLYQDDFADPASGWTVEDTSSSRWSYQAGEYEILVRNQDWFAAEVDPVDLPAGRYRVDVNVRQPTVTDALHAIVFDWRDWDNFKLLAIMPREGLVGLYAVENGSWVAYEALAPHPAAAVATEWHRVRIEQLDARTIAAINGVEVIDIGVSYTPGPFRVGFYLETLDQIPAAVRFDDLAVFSLPGGYVPSAPVSPLVAPAAFEGEGFWTRPLTGGAR